MLIKSKIHNVSIQRIGADTVTADKKMTNTIINHLANSHAGINEDNTAVAHKPTEIDNDSNENTRWEIGDSSTRIDSCNSDSEENNASLTSGNNSANSNTSLCQRIKVRV